MIAARLHGDGKLIVLMVLEPGNIEKLKQGQPIHKFLNEFIPELPTKIELMFAYSPDVEWVAQEMVKDPRNALRLAEILQESLSRKEVLVRDKSAEDMKKIT
jgi:hypothetical protein